MLKKLTKKRNQKGFTLVELVVVIAILGILAAIAVPRFTGIQDKAKKDADAATAESIISSARIYNAQENLSTPTTNMDHVKTLMDVPAPTSKDTGSFGLKLASPDNKYYIVTIGTEEFYYEETSDRLGPTK